MKKYYFLASALIILVGSVFSQTIPNAGFENWITTGSYANPQFWDSPNAETAVIPIIGFSTVTKSTDAHSGSFSARLETKSLLGMPIPGMLTLGNLTINIASFNFTLTGGVPFNLRPEKLKGFYKYAPAGGDTMVVGVVFYKNNLSGGSDTIGVAYYLSNAAVSTWTAFETYVDWFTSETPDTMNIFSVSSASMQGNAGTVLMLDDLGFDYSAPVATPQKSKETVVASYNPSGSLVQVYLTLPAEKMARISLVNLIGQSLKTVESEISTGSMVSIPVSDLPKGLYLVKVQAGTSQYVRKVVIR